MLLLHYRFEANIRLFIKFIAALFMYNFIYYLFCHRNTDYISSLKLGYSVLIHNKRVTFHKILHYTCRYTESKVLLSKPTVPNNYIHSYWGDIPRTPKPWSWLLMTVEWSRNFYLLELTPLRHEGRHRTVYIWC